MPSSTIARLERALQAADAIGALPAILQHAIAVLHDPNTGAADLARVVALDQGLTTSLLRLANSAYYGQRRRISTPKEAVVLVGFAEVRALVLAAGVIRAFRGLDDGPFAAGPFWAHAFTCGLLAQALARETRLAPPDEAFTAGVLHDLGAVVLCQTFPQEMAEVGRRMEAGAHQLEAELAVLGFTHGNVGWSLAGRWDFPDPLAHVLGHHHARVLDLDRYPLTALVAQAGRLCAAIHQAAAAGDPAEPEGLEPPVAAAIARLGGVPALLRRAADYVRTAYGRDGALFAALPPLRGLADGAAA